MNRSICDCNCGGARVICRCGEVFCVRCEEHDEDRCARQEYEWEREDAQRRFEEEFGS